MSKGWCVWRDGDSLRFRRPGYTSNDIPKNERDGCYYGRSSDTGPCRYFTATRWLKGGPRSLASHSNPDLFDVARFLKCSGRLKARDTRVYDGSTNPLRLQKLDAGDVSECKRRPGRIKCSYVVDIKPDDPERDLYEGVARVLSGHAIKRLECP